MSAIAAPAKPHRVGVPALLATGCGTAIASVCAFGLFQIERTLGGVWSAAAVLIAGACCFALARVCARLTAVVPSGAGLLAFLSRGLGGPLGLALVLPYLLLTLFLAGLEATIVGTLLSRLLPIPVGVGAVLFLLGTWAVCRAGFRVGYRAQATATCALMLGLGVLSLVCMSAAGHRGDLAARLLPPTPNPWDFVAGVGQSLFLFMGFELLTSQAEVADDPASVRRALGGSVVLLGAFYATVSLGFSCLALTPEGDVAPQLALAAQAGGLPATLLITGLSLLASFTSFNGALLTLSRLTAALAAQGILPRPFARVDVRSLVPRPALALLLALALAALTLVNVADLLRPSILAAAVAAALVYAGLAWVRQFAPFAEPQRPLLRRGLGIALVAGLVTLAAGVLLDAGAALVWTAALLSLAFVAAGLAGWRLRRKHTGAPIHGGAVHAR